MPDQRGIGPVTAAWLLVGTLNFALCPGPESLAAYAGLVPRAARVGAQRARPPQHRPRRQRAAAHRAVPGYSSTARHNPAIRAFFQRLRAAGKPLKVARCAAARKLLHLAWALATKQQRFDPHRGQHHGEGTADCAA